MTTSHVIHWSTAKRRGEALIAICGAEISRLQTPAAAHRLPDCARCLELCPPDEKDRAKVEHARRKTS